MEHRLIQGGEQFLPFARSCVAKLKKLGLPYANQSFEIDGVSIKVRIEPGHEYIRIEGGDTVSCFTNVTPPFGEGIVVGRVKGAKHLYGPYQPWYPDSESNVKAIYYVSPHSDKFVLLEMLPLADNYTVRFSGRGGVLSEFPRPASTGGVGYPQTVYSGIYPYAALGEYGTYSSRYAVYPVPSHNSSRSPVTVTLEGERRGGDFTDVKAHHYLYSETLSWPTWPGGPTGPVVIVYGPTVHYDSPVPVYANQHSPTDHTETFSGHRVDSSVHVRRYVTDSEGVTSLADYSLCPAPVTYGDESVQNLVSNDPFIESFYSGSVRKNCFDPDLNSILPSGEWARNYKALFQTTLCSTNKAGVVYVARLTKEESSGSYYTINHQTNTTSDPSPVFVRVSGFVVSVLTSDNRILESVVTKSLGECGYISGLIHSTKSNRIHVYYAVHDPSDTAELGLEGEFTEYLDTHDIDLTTGASTLVKSINLGHVSHTLSGVPGSALRMDRHNSKLYGAASEVGGYIWSDTHCMDTASGALYPIPNYRMHRETFNDPHYLRYNSRTSYLVNRGKSAMYYLLKFGDGGLGGAGDSAPNTGSYSSSTGLAMAYKLAFDDVTQEYRVTAGAEDVIQNSAFSNGEGDFFLTPGSQLVF